MKSRIFVREAVEMQEGAGARVTRLMPVADFRNFDPFVLFDDFRIKPGAGFPEHPHRGFEAVSYLFEGGLRHEDDLGNAASVGAGGVQRFTAGSGIRHSEMPEGQGKVRGVQLWINLPKRLKSVASAYQQIDPGAIPEHVIAGGRERVIAGEGSPLRLHTDVFYLDVTLDAGAEYRRPVLQSYRGFVYVADGAGEIEETTLSAGQAWFTEGAEEIRFRASDPCRVMLCFGQPHGEPILQHGSFVD